jgi:Flp pilus assembly protein TadD
MADNQVTVEQLLRALGQAVVQMSEKMDVLASKMDAVREELAGRAPSPAPGEEFFQAQFGRLESALAREDTREPVRDEAALELLGRMESSLEKLAAGTLEKLDALKEGLSGIAGPSAPGEEFFQAQFGRMESAVAGLSPQGAGSDSARQEALDSLGDRIERVVAGLAADVKESSERSASGISEASGLIIGAIGSIPETMKAVQQSMEGKADDIRRDAARSMEQAEEHLKHSEKVLDDTVKTGKKTEKVLEAVKEEMAQKLSENRDILSRLEEVTTRFAGKALEDGIATLNRSAVHHYNIGEYRAAEEDLAEAVNLDPGRAEVWCNMAHVQAASGREAEAEASFRKALELEPDLDQAVSGLGVLMMAGGRSEEAISFLEKFIADESPSVRTMIAYSRALASAGRHSDAVSVLERAAGAAPGNPEVKAELAAYTGEAGS